MVLLTWIGAVLCWLAGTVLRGRRDSFAFGTLASGLATVALMFVINPDAVIARANVAGWRRRTRADRCAARSVARRPVSARATLAAALAAGPLSLDPQLELVGGAGE